MGLAEGPMGPSIVCYLSGFYNRKELSLRFACSPSCPDVSVNNLWFQNRLILFNRIGGHRELTVKSIYSWWILQLSGAFSGLLAAAIQNMDGIGGRPGWAWIFILVCLLPIEGWSLFDRIIISRKVYSQSVWASLDFFSYLQLRGNLNSSRLSKKSSYSCHSLHISWFTSNNFSQTHYGTPWARPTINQTPW